jgi:hypothetical protein
MTANHVGHEIATFPGIRDGIGARTSTSVGLATPNYGLLVCSGVVSWGPRTEAVRNVGRAVALVWSATILAYAVIAVALIIGRSISLDKSWSMNGRCRIRRSTSLNRTSKAGCLEGIVSKCLCSPYRGKLVA